MFTDGRMLSLHPKSSAAEPWLHIVTCNCSKTVTQLAVLFPCTFWTVSGFLNSFLFTTMMYPLHLMLILLNEQTLSCSECFVL